MSSHWKSTVNLLSGALRELKSDALAGELECAHWFGVDRLVGMRYVGQGSILIIHSLVRDVARQLG